MHTLSMAVERYGVCIGISAKIENWDKPSVIVVSNGYSRALIIPAEVIQAALKLLGNLEPPQYTLMALLAYLVIVPDVERFSSVTLDQDYSGQVVERIIRRSLLELLRRHRPNLKASAVRMQNVAGNRADRLARDIYKGKRQADGDITLEDIQNLLWA
jgi:hypothetical protein